MDFVLKRLCSDERIVLDVHGKSYTCGRGRENEIICLSLLVSRKHCLFFHDTNKLYVTDLNSSNGIFINGKAQKPYKMVMLLKNDIVGIGSCESQPSNDSLFVYKVCIRKSSCPSEAVDTSVLSKTVLNCDAPPKQPNSPKRCILEEECGPNLASEMTMPCKIRKCTNEADGFSGRNPNAFHDHGSSSNDNGANNLEMAFNTVTIKTENDIEIIQTVPSTNITTKIANDEANSMLHFTHASDQVIKLENENEIQITDDDDANLTDASTKTTSTNSKLTKSRKAKKNSQTQFSEIDVVELSDDENGVFPPSQLFDITFAEREIKTEIKQECIDNNSEKIDLLEADDDVVILTDSEDEDKENPWLHRLSRSQLINQDKKPNVSTIVKEEVDFGIWDDDDISCIVKSEVFPVTKDYDEINDAKPMVDIPALDAFKIPINEERSIEQQTSSANDIIDREDSNTELLTKQTTETDDGTSSLMEVDDSSKECISENVKHTSRQRTDVKQDKKSNEQKETSDNLSSHSAKSRSDITKSTFKRVIQVIEAPHLPTRKGRSGKAIKSSEEQSSSKLSAKETKIKKLNEKVNNNFYNKEQKDKKETSKKTSDCSQSSKVIKTSISKEEKKIIVEERKAKLKKIAEEKNEEKKLCTDQAVKPLRTAKPRAKVSQKNRGDFLINGQESLASTSAKHIKSSSDQFKKQSINNADMSKNSAISDSETNLQQKEDLSKNALNEVAESLEQSLCLTKTPSIKIPKSDESVKSSEATNVIRKHSKRKKISNEANTKVPELKKESNKFASIAQKNSNFSNKRIKSESVMKKEKKRVSFSEKTQIIEYEIDIKNSLKKLEGKKDAPMPDNKMVKAAWNGDAEWSPKLEEFLLHIFMWNPVWLEEQRYLKTEPPIMPKSELQPMRMRYDSFQQYYKVVLPLLLLETWHTMTKDFEMVGRNMQHATVVCSIVANSITRTPIPSTNLFLTTLMLEVLVSKQDLNNRTYPRYGDLILFEYVKNENGKPIYYKVFAYITKMRPRVITDFTHYNKDLRNHVRNPIEVITYTVLTRPLENDIPANRLQRIRTVTYLRANMRMVQALQYLPQSPLLNLILNPKIDNYQLPSINELHTCSSLGTKDKLNPKQQEAVLKVAATVLNEQSKFCFIQGPPGTGKSTVIVNLVTQILYGKNENVKKPLNILICAPSNAAIDEIVMRLLAIRSTLRQKRFNMVRIGRPETMHPQAKNISVTELAKRHLKKIAENGVTWSLLSDGSACLKKEKAILQTRMDSIQFELKNSKNMLDERRWELKSQFNDATIRLQILTYGKPIDDFSPEDRDRYRRTAEDTILAGADIIACTLSSCYTNQMESNFGVSKKRLSVCIVDEATQSCEAETLIPLMLGVNTLVLVGDPNQLPATILSQRAKKLGLDQSLFSRVQGVFTSQTNNPIIMLDTQYRMAHDISHWPNRYFYNARLKNAVEARLTFPFHAYRVLNHTSSQNNDKFSNTTEAEFVANMIYAMLKFAKWENTNNSISIGILTPYNNQRIIVLNKIIETISSMPEDLKKRMNIEVNTVDSFQGQERDIIIMSCVRSEGIGFLSDRQRLCVALTRAKHSLILCGNFNTFMKDLMWKALLSDARSRGIFHNIEANATPDIIKPFVVR